jgi:hypothetical protein
MGNEQAMTWPDYAIGVLMLFVAWGFAANWRKWRLERLRSEEKTQGGKIDERMD